MLASLVICVALIILAAIFTMRFKSLQTIYKNEAGTLTVSEQAALDIALRRTSRIAQVAALVSTMPMVLYGALHSVPALVTTIMHLGVAVVAGIIVIIIKSIAKIPFRSFWDPQLTWLSQTALLLIGVFIAGVIPIFVELLGNPAVRLQILEKLFGK